MTFSTNGSASGVPLIDTHIHVDLYEASEQEPLLQSAFANGVDAVVAVSMHLASSKRNRELAERYAGQVMPAYGFHPEQPLPSEEEVERLLAWMEERAEAGEAFAVGEVGLPYYMRTEAEAADMPFDETGYVALLERFIHFAAKHDLPIALHAVYEDAAKALALLEAHGVRRAHFHWFKGSDETITRMIRQGYHISITPDVLYEPEIQAIVKRYPLDQIMTETDGPWPFEGPFAGERTNPGMVQEVAAAIARLKEIDAKEAAEQLYRNAVQFYSLSDR
ncbi:TatD DNase family protein [Paenibacillus phyllosphaerae]|uniref:TatD DNase family protein n=1 Tax=Paenibacillus phyllosphaerae TaxID=274593 RepID=A0A7W5AW33_9BACL|nr:TatD family hydrolase [Paenibacillus phyllosphaerae]MBB3109336.1 TatD DNase family protein [Paenibacillus phyllosphaerae]